MNPTSQTNLISLPLPVAKSNTCSSLAVAPCDFFYPCWTFLFCCMCRDWHRPIMKTYWVLRGIAEGGTEFLSSNSITFVEVGRIYIFNHLLSPLLLNHHQTWLCGFMVENIWRTCGPLLPSAGCLCWRLISAFLVTPLVVLSLISFLAPVDLRGSSSHIQVCKAAGTWHSNWLLGLIKESCLCYEDSAIVISVVMQ